MVIRSSSDPFQPRGMMSLVARGLRVMALLAAVAAVPAIPAVARAQRPSEQQVRTALQDPDMVARVRREIQNSGLTQGQLQARLRAEGYPENLLDPVLMSTEGDSTTRMTPEMFDAMKALGIVDSTNAPGLDSLRRRLVRNQQAVVREDSMFVDSLAKMMEKDDSLRVSLRRFLRSREVRSTYADSGFTVFGRDVFERNSTQLAANLSGPVDDNYRLGIGDRLVLAITGDVENAYQLQVNREGFILIPNVGNPLYVAGLSKGDAHRLIANALSRVYSRLRPDNTGSTRMMLTVATMGTKQVYVAGDVVKPGAYSIPNSGSILTALYQAGGPSETGTMRHVELKRGARTVGVIDVYDYLLTGNTATDLRAESGDVVFVPPRGGQVRVTGAVMRPGTYELLANETLADVVRMAGGFRPSADLRRVQVERYVPPEQRDESGRDRRMVSIALNQWDGGNATPVALEPGDVVRVESVPERLAGRVTVKGNVWHEGRVAFTPGMRLSEALQRAGGIKSDTYLEQVSISRLLPDSTREMLRSALRDTLGTPTNDLVLSDFDEIEVFSMTDFRPQRYVTVGGAVRKGGKVPYRDGMTIRDAVLEAGGLLESALLTEAEVARVAENRADGVIARTMRVPLDSTYLFERTANGAYRGPPGIPAPAQKAPDFTLRPYDNVTIMQQPNWSLTEIVSVQGEVKYPAVYAITSKNERIADVIRRAGGLTSEAYANGVVFVRKKREIGRVGIDLPAVLKNPRHPDNLPLADGDSLFIPKYVGVVTVRGAVNSPVGVAYAKGQDLDYYIRAAGGGTVKADRKRAYVTQPNGKTETRHREALLFTAVPQPQPGSLVVVPEKDPTEHHADLAQVTTLTVSLLGSLAAVVAIFK